MECDGEALREHLAPSADAPSKLGSPEMPLDTSTRDIPILAYLDASFKSWRRETVMSGRLLVRVALGPETFTVFCETEQPHGKQGS
jgi:hypothetical protein